MLTVISQAAALVRDNDSPPRETWDEMWARPFDWDKFNSVPPE
jgi:hypothetical protein